jgi:outer membrane autotransporter protein
MMFKTSGAKKQASVRMALLTGTALVGFTFALPAQAQQTWEGGTSTDWFDPANWTTAVPAATDDVFIATTDAPNMPVIDGADAVAERVYLGDGGAPTGTLTIQNGGTLSNGFAAIGADAGFNYSVLVTGAGSQWANGITLAVGDEGTGFLTISDGGAVSNAVGYIGLNAGSTGTVSVIGAGSNWTNSQDLYVGWSGTGTLEVSDGGAVSNATGYIGSSAGSTGMATVTGAGSSWTNADDLYVGDQGTGSLTISDGGMVSNALGYIGLNAGSTGTVTVTGAGSSWANSEELYVGWSGAGALEISDGGAVSNEFGVIGFNAGSTGTVSVTGAGSQWTNSELLYVGESGTGALEISDGGVVGDEFGIIGSGAGSTGTVSVTGAGSQWTNGTTLFVGDEGTGSLTISDGGAVSNTAARIGNAGSSVGTVTVTGPGSSWSNANELRVGNFGTGSLSILNGGTVSSANISVGARPTGSGMVTVDGFGSTLSATSEIYVGDEGDGSLTVSNGGTVTNTFARIGNMATISGTGTVTVDGAGSTWTNTSEIYVGNEGDGSLTISNGGAVSNTFGFIGFGAGSTGTVSVTGAGSSWTNADDLYVGDEGTGVLEISDGGAVSNTRGLIGGDPAAIGTVTVDGAGSTWATSGFISVGIDGTASLTISNGGLVDVAAGSSFLVAQNAGSTGTLNIGAAAGDAAVGAGLLDTASLDFRAGTGTLVFNHTDSAYTFAPDITGFGTILHAAGTTSFTGDGSGFSGTTNVSGGSLYVNDILGGMVTVTGGLLGGSGTLTGDVTVTGGTLAAGNSPGTFTIGGDLVLGSASSLAFELGDPSGTAGVDSDLINVGGNLTLDGTLNVTDAGDFGAGLYRLINYGGALTDNGLDVGTAPAGYLASYLTVDTATAGQVNLLVAAIPLTFWDGPNTADNGTVDGGTGTWDAVTTNWTSNTGTPNSHYDPTSLLIFSGAAGTVTVDNGAGAVSTSGMQFAVDGYTLTGDDLTLSGSAVIRVGDGSSAGAEYSTTIGANLIGTGSLEKTDLGTLILTGTNTYTGGTTISDGTLLVNGSIGGTLDILGGGTLGGSGTVGTIALASGGTLAPGNSIGTLNVAGNVTFDAGSIYEVELNAAGGSDLIEATGTATIDGGTVHVVPLPDYAVGTQYHILHADGGASGAFDAVTGIPGTLFLTPTLSYAANDVYFSIDQTASFESIALTPNQIAAAGGADSLGGGNSLWNAIADLNDGDEARAAFDGVSGEIHASAKTALIEDSRFAREAALGRLHDAKQAAQGKTGLWMQGFGSWGSWDSGGNAAELDRSIGGVFLGGDALVMDSVRLGLFGGYSDSSFDVDERNSSGSAENWHLGAYAGAEAGNLALRLGGAYSWHDLTSARSASFTGFSDSLTASYSARTGQLFGEAGYRFDTGAVSIEPFANLAYVHLKTGSYTETGGAAALTAPAQSTDATFTTIGLRAETGLDLGETPARLTGMAGWRHAFDEVTPFATHAFAGGSAFTVAGTPIAPDAFVLDLGASVEVTPGARLGVSYGGQFGSGFTDHSVKANLSVRF